MILLCFSISNRRSSIKKKNNISYERRNDMVEIFFVDHTLEFVQIAKETLKFLKKI